MYIMTYDLISRVIAWRLPTKSRLSFPLTFQYDRPIPKRHIPQGFCFMAWDSTTSPYREPIESIYLSIMVIIVTIGPGLRLKSIVTSSQSPQMLKGSRIEAGREAKSSLKSSSETDPNLINQPLPQSKMDQWVNIPREKYV